MNEVFHGDCRDILPTLPAESVHTCVTSPPYFGLRDYGHADQIGLERTPEEYVETLVAVFREVRRVLRDDGTLWLNLGDSYARSPGKGQHKPGSSGKQAYIYDKGNGRASSTLLGDGLKEKDLIGIPWRVAFALQADGWYLRQDIIWHKPNSMPESVKDRCTKAHEYLFLLAKSGRYYFDQEAIKGPVSPKTLTVKTTPRKGTGQESTGEKLNKWMEDHGGRKHPEKVNKRSVWSVSSRALSEAHFAVFPENLIEPCVIAGAPAGGVVLDPFMGSGTVGRVAERLGRAWIGCEINGEYCDISKRRTAQKGLGL